MTEAIATDMLRSYIDRILRLKAEQDDIAAGIREIYTEAKSNGYDKTAIGQVVTQVRKEEKNPERYAELTALAALYMDAYEGRSAPARARVEIIEEFPPETSLADSEPPPSPAVAPPAMTAPADQESAVPSPIVASSTPSDDDATAPRAGRSREQSPARGDIDISLPSFLDRKSPDCIANRAQGRG